MSRFDQPTQEPDFDRYDAKPLDAVDEPQDDPPVDPVERADYALILAIDAVEELVIATQELDQINRMLAVLRNRTRHILTVSDNTAGKVDQILERRR